MNKSILTSKTVVAATSTEALKQAEFRALSDDELNVVAGGAKNRLVDAFVDGFIKGGGQECVTSSSGKSTVCF
jgi:hypothetical protein